MSLPDWSLPVCRAALIACCRIPEPPHPGGFAVVRKHHIHEGIDLYVPEGTPVWPVEPGRIVTIEPFTGPAAGSPWWHDTQCVMIEGASGVVCYGEITPNPVLKVGSEIGYGAIVGHVKQVLTKDKGRPMSMLHLELYEHGVRHPVEWKPKADRPRGLLDPTPKLKAAFEWMP